MESQSEPPTVRDWRNNIDMKIPVALPGHSLCYNLIRQYKYTGMTGFL